MLLSKKIRSVDHLPDYTGVQLEALALSPQGPKLNWRMAQHNGFSLYCEEYFSRIRFQEVQHGDTVFLGLVLPNGEPVRSSPSSFESLTLMYDPRKVQI